MERGGERECQRSNIILSLLYFKSTEYVSISPELCSKAQGSLESLLLVCLGEM